MREKRSPNCADDACVLGAGVRARAPARAVRCTGLRHVQAHHQRNGSDSQAGPCGEALNSPRMRMKQE